MFVVKLVLKKWHKIQYSQSELKAKNKNKNKTINLVNIQFLMLSASI